MARVTMLSTIDNPFNPVEDFDNWYRYDVDHGYYSCSKLARVLSYPDSISETEAAILTEQAIDNIIKYDFTNTFIKVLGSPVGIDLEPDEV